MITEISDLAEENKGKHHLKFMLRYEKEGYRLELRSKQFKVNLDDDFLSGLKQMQDLNYKSIKIVILFNEENY